ERTLAGWDSHALNNSTLTAHTPKGVVILARTRPGPWANSTFNNPFGQRRERFSHHENRQFARFVSTAPKLRRRKTRRNPLFYGKKSFTALPHGHLRGRRRTHLCLPLQERQEAGDLRRRPGKVCPRHRGSRQRGLH